MKYTCFFLFVSSFFMGCGVDPLLQTNLETMPSQTIVDRVPSGLLLRIVIRNNDKKIEAELRSQQNNTASLYKKFRSSDCVWGPENREQESRHYCDMDKTDLEVDFFRYSATKIAIYAYYNDNPTHISFVCKPIQDADLSIFDCKEEDRVLKYTRPGIGVHNGRKPKPIP